MKGIMIMMLAGAATSTPPENRYGEAMMAVDNAISCFPPTDERVERFRASLRALEKQANDVGLEAEVEHQRQMVIMDYRSSLRVQCHGGPDRATRKARKKLKIFRHFIVEYLK